MTPGGVGPQNNQGSNLPCVAGSTRTSSLIKSRKAAGVPSGASRNQLEKDDQADQRSAYLRLACLGMADLIGYFGQ